MAKISGSGWKLWLSVLQNVRRQGVLTNTKVAELQGISFSWASQLLDWMSHAGLVKGVRRGSEPVVYSLTGKGLEFLGSYEEHIIGKGKFLKMREELQELKRVYVRRSKK